MGHKKQKSGRSRSERHGRRDRTPSQGGGHHHRDMGRGGRRAPPTSPGRVTFYGKHAVKAALNNPSRHCLRLYATQKALGELGHPPQGLEIQTLDTKELSRHVAQDAVHQGLVLDAAPLESPHIEDILSGAGEAETLLVLDQVTDPHNIGAILRSAAAFGASAIISQDRHSPPETGALAKAASGALERVPWVRVVNLARALDQIAEAGFWRVGLDGEAEETLANALPKGPICLVMGAEGRGLRPNTAQHCDALAKLPMTGNVESLNVSNAAAISLYVCAQRL